MFSVVNVYLDHLKFCVVCIHGRRYVCCGECYVVSNECYEPTSCLVQPIGAHCCEVIYFVCFCFSGELGFMNCDDICMCVVNKQFELLEFVFDSVYVELQYDEIFLTFIYIYLLPTVYLFMADITNPDLFVCGCRTWICLDITRFYEEQRQPFNGSAWPAYQKIVNQAPIAWGGRFRHNLRSSL